MAGYITHHKFLVSNKEGHDRNCDHEEDGEGVAIPEQIGQNEKLKFNFCKANIVFIHAWHDDLSETHLFAEFGHEIVLPV